MGHLRKPHAATDLDAATAAAADRFTAVLQLGRGVRLKSGPFPDRAAAYGAARELERDNAHRLFGRRAMVLAEDTGTGRGTILPRHDRPPPDRG